VQAEVLPFPLGGAPGRFQQALLVLAALPPALAGQTGTLTAALFDNQDSDRSFAFVNEVTVVPGPGTMMVLESSAAAGGPYAREDEVLIRHARQSLTLPNPGAHRFYRLRGNAPSRIIDIHSSAADSIVDYSGGGSGVPVLESSAQVSGPYAAENGVSADAVAHSLRVPRNCQTRFFRIGCDIPLRIRGLAINGNSLLIEYE